MIHIQQFGVYCALGLGADAVRQALFAATPPAPSVSARYSPGRALPLGLARPEPAAPPAHWPLTQHSRTNALLAPVVAAVRPAAEAACARWGAHRVATILGSSTAGVGQGDAALRAHLAQGAWPAGYDYGQQEMHSPAAFVARELGLTGPAWAISTACSSGAKALAAGARLLRAGLADAVVCGGADELCALTVAGFSALESVSARVCNPGSRHRDGIHLGEGAALFVLSREDGPLRLAGWGESADAHHLSAPEPSGRGAQAAMQAALNVAGLAPQAIDYLNLHGTATVQNDAMEARALHAVFGARAATLPVSSTKPLTGHTLAAAGAIEAALCALTLLDNRAARLPPHHWDGQADPALPPLHWVAPGECAGQPPRCVMSNSFAFGGSNAALILATP